MRTTLSAALLLAALAAAPAVGQTPPAPPDGPPPAAPADAAAQDVQGVVAGYNFDPRGSVNSVEVKAGDRLAQFKLPSDQGAAVAAAAPVGQQVTATGVPERALPDRTLYRLTKLTPADGKAMSFGGPGSEPTVHVEGTVRRLNVAPRGEVDGAVLDGGDFVHTGPESAVGLRVGDKLAADGRAHPMADGHRAVEATAVNGTPVRHPPKPGERGPKPQRPGNDDGPPPPPPAP